MSVRIGHASISENGTVNGAKGDQTGREVCIRTFYSRPWDYVAIHPDATVREKHAKAIEAACANDNIGYSQSNRNTLNILAKAAGYDLSKVGKCNCDCSSLQNVAAVASGASGATYGSNGWTTSTMKAALQKLGYKIITEATYLASSAYCVRGAIYVKASSHTVCALDNGANYKKMLEKAGISLGTQRATVRSGSRGTDVTYLQQRLAVLGYKPGAADGIFGSKTLAAVKAFQTDHKLAVDGIAGPKTWAALAAE